MTAYDVMALFWERLRNLIGCCDCPEDPDKPIFLSDKRRRKLCSGAGEDDGDGVCTFFLKVGLNPIGSC